MKTLIADNDHASRSILKKMLFPYSECDTAKNGKEAMELFKQNLKDLTPYNLICMDISLPYMNGIELLKIIRKVELSYNIADEKKLNALIITNITDKKIVFKAYSLKAHAYLLKPLKKDKLFEKLSELGFDLKILQRSRRDNIKMIGTVKKENIKLIEQKPKKRISNSTSVVKPNFLVKISSGLLGQDGKLAAKANYHKLLTSFDNVKEGDIIALIPPESDVPNLGAGVTYDQQKRIIKSTVSGRVEYKKQTVSVEDTIIMHENIGPKTGNINFSGFLIVHGDVKNNYSIYAGKGILITGRVGVSTLNSNGDIKVECVYDMLKGSITCGGNFYGRLIYNSTISSLGNIYIRTEAVNSILKSRGIIDAREGTIAGGICIGLKGIDTSNLGSTSNLQTIVEPGTDYLIYDKTASLESKQSDIKKQIEKIDQMLGEVPVILNLEFLKKIPKKRKITVLKYLREKEKLQSQEKEIIYALELSRSKTAAENNEKVNIHNTLYPGIIFNIGKTSHKITKPKSGPVSTIEKPNGGIIFLPYTSLKQNASDLKEKLVVKVDSK